MTDIEWGLAIAVDGKRPGWLDCDQKILPIVPGKPELVARIAGNHVWDLRGVKTTHIHLPADHPHYRQPAPIPEGMKPWHGGDAAPADWDSEKPIAVIDDGKVSIRYGHRWDWSREPVTAYGHKLLRVVAYTPQPTPQADTKPDLTARMEAFVQRVATEADYPCQMVDFRNEARAIVALLPEPVDPDEDEAMQLAAEIRCGGPSVKLALAAIKRGRALALAGKVGA